MLGKNCIVLEEMHVEKDRLLHSTYLCMPCPNSIGIINWGVHT